MFFVWIFILTEAYFRPFAMHTYTYKYLYIKKYCNRYTGTCNYINNLIILISIGDLWIYDLEHYCLGFFCNNAKQSKQVLGFLALRIRSRLAFFVYLRRG